MSAIQVPGNLKSPIGLCGYCMLAFVHLQCKIKTKSNNFENTLKVGARHDGACSNLSTSKVEKGGAGIQSYLSYTVSLRIAWVT